MCISVKKFQQKKFDVSQKPLIQKMHTEPEILNWGLGGSIVCSDLHLCDSPARGRSKTKSGSNCLLVVVVY